MVEAGAGGVAVEKWYNVELREVRNRRVDLPGESAVGKLVRIELPGGPGSSVRRAWASCSASAGRDLEFRHRFCQEEQTSGFGYGSGHPVGLAGAIR